MNIISKLRRAARELDRQVADSLVSYERDRLCKNNFGVEYDLGAADMRDLLLEAAKELAKK